MTEEIVQRRPFHETIVDVLESVRHHKELRPLGTLIKETEVPKNHDEIITAWNQARSGVGLDVRANHSVVVDLLKQKEEAAKKAEEKAKAKEQAEAVSS